MDTLLFLDIDGVLHPKEVRSRSDQFCQLPLLIEVLEDAPCDVIITSDWRFHYTIDELRRLFPERFQRRILGSLGQAIGGRHGKFKAVSRLLHALGLERVSWRCLDADYFAYPRHLKELILCHPRTGFSEREARILHDWLKTASLHHLPHL